MGWRKTEHSLVDVTLSLLKGRYKHRKGEARALQLQTGEELWE